MGKTTFFPLKIISLNVVIKWTFKFKKKKKQSYKNNNNKTLPEMTTNKKWTKDVNFILIFHKFTQQQQKLFRKDLKNKNKNKANENNNKPHNPRKHSYQSLYYISLYLYDSLGLKKAPGGSSGRSLTANGNVNSSYCHPWYNGTAASTTNQILIHFLYPSGGRKNVCKISAEEFKKVREKDLKNSEVKKKWKNKNGCKLAMRLLKHEQSLSF